MNLEIAYNLGSAHEALGDAAMAIPDYKRIFVVNIVFQYVRRKLTCTPPRKTFFG